MGRLNCSSLFLFYLVREAQNFPSTRPTEWAGYDDSGYGNYVIINHGDGYKTLYGHCSSVSVSQGQKVTQGQTIAAIGSTGQSTGNHLHFEVRTGDERSDRQNPLSYVSY